MWNWFNCYMSGRHEYGMWCEPGTIFLRCVHCGRRSAGWTVNDAAPKPHPVKANVRSAGPGSTRIVPFKRRVAS